MVIPAVRLALEGNPGIPVEFDRETIKSHLLSCYILIDNQLVMCDIRSNPANLT